MTYSKDTTSNNDEALEAFLDAGAEALAQLRQDWAREKQLIAAENHGLQADLEALLAPMRERLAMLEGQMAVLLGGDTNPPRAKRAKQAPVNGNGRLLEHRPQ
jgi:hypothetical protein